MLKACMNCDVCKIVSFQATKVEEEFDCGQNRSAVCVSYEKRDRSAIWLMVANRQLYRQLCRHAL